MKFLHTADLHIGKKLNEIDLLEDQKFVLNQISAKAQSCDAVLIAGDIYDVSVPSGEALRLYSDFIETLIKNNKTVFAVSGNHDSGERLSQFSALMRESGYYISEKFNGKLQTFTVNDEFGEINIHLLPFIRPANVSVFSGEKYETTEDAVKAVINNANIDYSERNILIIHQFVMPENTDNEFLGTLETVRSGLFERFDYVAVGHIHSNLNLGYDYIRYSGSPLKYSFKEISDNKTITIVEIKEKGNIQIKKEELTPLREMREIKGTLDEILNTPFSLDYVSVIVQDKDVPPDARVSVLTVFPNMMRFSIASNNNSFIVEVLEIDEKKSDSQMFSEFYNYVNGEYPDDLRVNLFEKAMKELQNEAD